MTLGELMENMATVAEKHGTNGMQVIKGLTKYADEAVDGAGNINSSYWDFFGPIIHGRRAEIEFLAKNADAVPGADVVFEVVNDGAKRISDVDAFLNGAAVSIKRQGKTLDKWVKDRGEDWLKKYMTKVMTGGGKLPPSGQLIFRTGKELPSPETQKRLRDIVENSDYLKDSGFTVSFEVFEILPPPNIN
jgi:hypothetical protein